MVRAAFQTAIAMCLALVAAVAAAGPLPFAFASIDGGQIEMARWHGQPELVVNTASQCAYTRQYDGLQALYDTYRDQGLVVLAVPSDDFRQELADEAAVKDFCALNFALDLPMTAITHVRGAAAHPFYRSVRSQTGFQPRWNFNKVLLNGEGRVVATWGAQVTPMSPQITDRIEDLLR